MSNLSLLESVMLAIKSNYTKSQTDQNSATKMKHMAAPTASETAQYKQRYKLSYAL